MIHINILALGPRRLGAVFMIYPAGMRQVAPGKHPI